MRVLSLFDGLGGARQSLKELNIDVKAYYASEIDKYAIKIAQNFSDIKHIGDINDIDFTLNEKEGPFDLIIGGSPCFKAGTLIITDKGVIQIEDIRIGDKVLTHTNSFKKVTNVGNSASVLHQIGAKGIEKTYTTANHPYYVRTQNNYKGLGQPYWKCIKNLTDSDRIGIPINNKSENPKNLTNEECWILGQYSANGFFNYKERLKGVHSYEVIFYIKKSKITEVENVIREFSKVEERNTYQIRIWSKKLTKLCLEFEGDKNIFPLWVENLPVKLLKTFIEGYVSGKGQIHKQSISITNVKRVIAHQMSRCVAKVYSTPVTLQKSFVGGYSLTYSLVEGATACIKNGVMWVPIKWIKNIIAKDKVYNLTVEKDNSYCANNAIVHNCTDLSIAKKNRKGLSGKRSGLFWKMADLIERFKPKYFLVENVASMPKKAKHTITSILGVEPIMINSALLTAQNRKRLYWTNIKGIKQPEDKHIYLKDIIEEGIVDRVKSLCLDAKGTNLTHYHRKSVRQLVFSNKPIRLGHLNKGGQGDRVYDIKGKSVALSANGGGRGAKTGLYEVPQYDKHHIDKIHGELEACSVRKLTPIECERLQGFPDNYTEGVSNSQRYKMLGNSFTIPVITHILNHMELS